MTIKFQDHLASVGQRHPDLADELARFNTLENVLRWMPKRGLSLATIDVVTQDEFSHDVLVPLEDGKLHLAFGVT
jgi:hypothetical protein